MTRAAERAGVFLAVHENFRFQTPMLKLKAALASGEIGEPNWARISFRTGYDLYRTQPYFYTEERFILLDLGVHTLDMARVLLGEVERVYCETQRRNPKVRAEDTATVILKHVSGAVSVVDFSYESRKLPDPFPETIVEIETPKGAIVVKPGLTMEVTSGGAMRVEDIGAPLLPWTARPWHVAQESVLITCRHMLERYRAGKPAATSAADNLKTFALVEACYKFCRERRLGPAERRLNEWRERQSVWRHRRGHTSSFPRHRWPDHDRPKSRPLPRKRGGGRFRKRRSGSPLFWRSRSARRSDLSGTSSALRYAGGQLADNRPTP